MKRPFTPVWLAISLVANVALLGVWLTRDPRERNEAPRVTEPASETKHASAKGAVDVSGLAPEVVARIGAGDEATLRDVMLACGMEPKAVRHLVASAVARRFEAEKIAARRRHLGASWWKDLSEWWKNPELEIIDTRQKTEVGRLVGDLPEDESSWDSIKLDYLPAEKRAALRMLNGDYEALEKKLPAQPWLPHEREMFETLLKEKRRDVEATLSAEELAEYDFRDHAYGFAQNLDKYGITDAELRALWRADKERDTAVRELEIRYGKPNRDPFATEGSNWPPEAREAERGLDEAYEARKLEILGAERIARGNREADESYKGIVKVTDKLGLGREKAEAVYAVIERAQMIGQAEDLDRDEQRVLATTAWKEIAEQVPPDALLLLKRSLGFQHYWLTSTEN